MSHLSAFWPLPLTLILLVIFSLSSTLALLPFPSSRTDSSGDMYSDSMDFAWAPPPQKRLVELPPWGYDRLAPTFAPNAPAPRITLAGSLDPTTGIFYRTPEHPRLRTAQACDKCRTRKAKCSGDHPSCARCLARGLVCEYAKEGRVRGPNKGLRSRSRAPSASTSPTSSPYSDLPTVTASSTLNTALDAATLEGLGIPKPRRRRHTTLSAAPSAALPPLASTRPLALPAPSTGVVAPNPKRLSLPTSLDLGPLTRLAPPVPSNVIQYHEGNSESRRDSYDSYAGEAGYDSYTHTLAGQSKQEGAFQLEAGYALDVAHYSPYSPDSHFNHPRHSDVNVRHPPALALRTDTLPLGMQRRTSADGVGINMRGSNVRRTCANSLNTRPSSASESGSSQSSFEGSSNPPSGVSGSFPLFRAPDSPQECLPLTNYTTYSHANAPYSPDGHVHRPSISHGTTNGPYLTQGYHTSSLQQPLNSGSQPQFDRTPYPQFNALCSQAYSSDGQSQTPSPLSAGSAPASTSSFGSPRYRAQSAHGHLPFAYTSRPHSADSVAQAGSPFAYDAAREMEGVRPSSSALSLGAGHASSLRLASASSCATGLPNERSAGTGMGSDILRGWVEPASMRPSSSSIESTPMGFSVPMPIPMHTLCSQDMSMTDAVMGGVSVN